jgi:hypothetical protein
MIPVTLEKVDQHRGPATVKDGKHHKLTCSNCEAPLADIWETSIIHRDDPWLIRANCAHCGDLSGVVEVFSATYHLGVVENEDGSPPYSLLKSPTVGTNRSGELVFTYDTAVNRKWGA